MACERESESFSFACLTPTLTLILTLTLTLTCLLCAGYTMCAGISSSALHNEASTPSSAKNVDVNRLRDENKVLRISLKEESRLR